MVGIFVTLADMKIDSDVSAFYGSLNQEAKTSELIFMSAGVTKISIMNDFPSHLGIYSKVLHFFQHRRCSCSGQTGLP